MSSEVCDIVCLLAGMDVRAKSPCADSRHRLSLDHCNRSLRNQNQRYCSPWYSSTGFDFDAMRKFGRIQSLDSSQSIAAY